MGTTETERDSKYPDCCSRCRGAEGGNSGPYEYENSTSKTARHLLPVVLECGRKHRILRCMDHCF